MHELTAVTVAAEPGFFVVLTQTAGMDNKQ